MGIPVPKEYGGQGCDPLTYVTCVEELSKVCATTGVIVSAHTSLCIDPIMTFGTEEQKKKYVVPLAKGEKLGAFGLTEPGAGTDAQGCQTKAVLDGDEWVLNGSKCFITNGKVADVYIVIAITSITEDKRGRKKKNFSAFIVEKGAPGFSFGTKEKKMGIRGSSTYELIFTDCRIPKENLLGQKGKGFHIAMHTLDGGRIGIAAQALGLAEGALDRTVAYVKERKQFGRTIDTRLGCFSLLLLHGLFEQLEVQIIADAHHVAGLLGTEHIACTANFQITHGNLEARAERCKLTNRTEPLLRDLAQRLAVPVAQVGVGRESGAAAPDPYCLRSR